MKKEKERNKRERKSAMTERMKPERHKLKVERKTRATKGIK
jgi:hypothetical protein